MDPLRRLEIWEDCSDLKADEVSSCEDNFDDIDDLDGLDLNLSPMRRYLAEEIDHSASF